MLRVRTLIILILTAWLIYALLPAEKKQRIRGRVKQAWLATTVAILLYWAIMLGMLAWKHWSR